MSKASVDVSGISPTTTETELHDFFSFCGKITSIELKGAEGASKSAVITFDKSAAANTALMLDQGTLGGGTLSVTSEAEHVDNHETAEVELEHQSPHRTGIEQSDKPRAGIAAEYLAKGYTLHDTILQRAIEIDNKHGISKKFLAYMSDLDKSVGQRAVGPDQTISGKAQSTFKEAHTRVKSIDEQKGYSKTASEYYTKALSSSLGKSVFSFYTDTSKQIRDIHEEAVRIKQHKPQPAATTPPAPSTPGAQSEPSK